MAEKVIVIADSITVGELAETLNISVTTLVGELFKKTVSSQQLINVSILKQPKLLLKNWVWMLKSRKKKRSQLEGLFTNYRQTLLTDLRLLPSWAHVDHGKTSLLDAILKTKTVDDEAGGNVLHSTLARTKRSVIIVLLHYSTPLL